MYVYGVCEVCMCMGSHRKLDTASSKLEKLQLTECSFLLSVSRKVS